MPFGVENLAQTTPYDPSRQEEYVTACRSCGISRQREAIFAAAAAAAAAEKPVENGHPKEVFVARCANGEAESIPSSLPFANLREKTFDMTKRGKLTPANVWYVSRRKDPAAVGGSHHNRGNSGEGVVAKATPEGEGLRDSGEKACSDRCERTNDLSV